MKKLDINDCIIEVTRRCNMKCEHCLRGNVQKLDISDEILETFFSKVSSISRLTITGGEPSLVPDRIRKIVSLAKANKVSIDMFYMATNAKQVTVDFLIALIELYAYCQHTDMKSSVEYSDDRWHEHVESSNINLLSSLSFVSPRGNQDWGHYNLLREGRAKQNGMGSREVFKDEGFTTDWSNENSVVVDGEFVLNAKGNVVNNCNYSYASQDKKKNIVCSVNDLSEMAIIEWSKKFEEADSLVA